MSSCSRCPAGKINTDPYATDAGLHDAGSDCNPCPSGKFSSTDSSSCIVCPAGTYVFNMSSCEFCTSGRYAPTAVNDDCISCPAGLHTKVLLGASTCTACDAGTYSAALAVNCTLCNVGRSSLTQAPNCTKCIPGFHAAFEGSSSCSACAGGSSTGEIYGASACFSCPEGTFQAETGQAACRVCSTGSYADSTGTLSCTACAAGYYVNKTGSKECDVCPIGTAQPEAGTTSCRECVAGKYSDVVASSACTNCAAGYYVNKTGSTECLECTVGKYQSATGQSSCFPCAIGKYGDSTASSSCSECSLGRYQSLTGTTACLLCTKGKATAVTGQPSCRGCESGRYSDVMGASICSLCAAGYFSHPESTNCSMCNRGYFHHRGSCVRCGEGDWIGATCDRRGLRLESITLKPGYWRTSSFSDKVLSCEDGDACVGGNETQGLCARGHYGPWCSNCLDGYYSPDIRECESCSGKEKRTVIIIIAVVLLVMLVLVFFASFLWRLWYSSGDSTNPTWRPEDNPSVVHRNSVLKLVLIFAQAIASLQAIFDMDFPFPFHHIVEISHVFAFDIAPLTNATPLTCVTGHVEFYQTLKTMTLLPLVVVLLRLGSYFWNRRASVTMGRVRYVWTKVQRDIVVVLFLMQPLASKVAFQTYVCTDPMDDGGIYLEADLTLRCDTVRHTFYLVYAGLMIVIWPVGVTALFAVALYRSRERISGEYFQVTGDARGIGQTEKQYHETDAIAIEHRSPDTTKNVQLFEALSGRVNQYLDGDVYGIDELFFRLAQHRVHCLSRVEFKEALCFLCVSTLYHYADEEVEALFNDLSSRLTQHAGVITLDSFSFSISLQPLHDPRLQSLSLLLTYRNAVFAWELVVMVRRVILGAALVVLGTGQISQAAAGTFVAFIGTALQAHFFPFEDQRENYLALSMDASVLFCLQFGLLVMTDSKSLSSTPWRMVGCVLTIMTIGCILYAAKLSVGQTAEALWQEHRKHRLLLTRRRTDAVHRTTRGKRSAVIPDLSAAEDSDRSEYATTRDVNDENVKEMGLNQRNSDSDSYSEDSVHVPSESSSQEYISDNDSNIDSNRSTLGNPNTVISHNNESPSMLSVFGTIHGKAAEVPMTIQNTGFGIQANPFRMAGHEKDEGERSLKGSDSSSYSEDTSHVSSEDDYQGSIPTDYSYSARDKLDRMASSTVSGAVHKMAVEASMITTPITPTMLHSQTTGSFNNEATSIELTRSEHRTSTASCENGEESSVNYSDSDSYSEDPSHVSSDAGNRDLISGNESDLSDDYTIENTHF